MAFRSLHFKVNIAILAASLLITGIFAVILYPLEMRRYEDRMKGVQLLLDTLCRQKHNQIILGMLAGRDEDLEVFLEEILRTDGIIGAAISRSDGSPIASRGIVLPSAFKYADDKKAAGSFHRVTRIEDEKPCMVYTSPIQITGSQLGFFRIYYDLSPLNQERNLSIAVFVILLGITLLLMGVILNVSLTRLVIRPVTVLRKAMGLVEEGHLGQTVHIASDDEIGDMGRAFNNMSLRLFEGQQTIKAAEQKYRKIFENAIEGIFQWTGGVEGRFLTVNPAMVKLLRYESQEELLQSVSNVARQLFVDRDSVERLELLLRQNRYVIGFETRLFRRDATVGWFSISASGHLDAWGNVSRLEGSLVDITERKDKEQAEREREAAEMASRSKSEFVANMSHEIRTPINAILGFTDLLGALITDPKQRNYLESIRSSGRSLLSLLSDILDLSKIEAGKMDIHLEPVQISGIFREIQQIFSVYTAGKNVALITEIGPAIREYLMLDEVRIRQVLFNLVGNALKFTESGHVKLSALGEFTAGEGVLDLVLRVEDTGPGIPPVATEGIFESFTQQCGHGSKSYGGSGLGLTISKNLVGVMGGTITVESSLGHGSIFTVKIPGVHVCSPGLACESVTHGERRQQPSLHGTIVVADDLEVNRRLIGEFLQDHDVSILVADNGARAVELALKHNPDIILMDLKMPVMNGFEAVKALKGHSQTRDIPVIAVTALGLKEARDRILSSPFDDHLFRPFDGETLVRRLARFIGSIPKDETDNPSRCITGENASGRPFRRLELVASDVRNLLQNDLMTQWTETMRKQRITDIEEFGARVKALGDEHGVVALSRFGEDLLFHVSGFDIENIRETLESYPKLISSMDEAECRHG